MKVLIYLVSLLFIFVQYDSIPQTIIWQSTDFSLSGNVNLVHMGTNNVIYAGTFGSGIFVSTDKGQSWTSKNNGLSNLQIFAFLNVADTLYAGTLAGVFRTTDNGNDWESFNNGLFDPYINALAITKDKKLLVGTLYNGLFISTNFGRSWTQMQNDFKNKSVNCILAKSDGFVLVGTTSGLYRATQMFDFWGKVDADLKNNNNINTLAVDSSGNIYAGTNNGYIFKSTNNGVNWTQVFFSANTAIYKITVSPQNVVFVATYGKGVLRSKDAGTSWEEVNDGLYNPYATGIATLPTRELFVSTWGNGVFYGKEYEISTFVEGEYCTGNEISIQYQTITQFNPDNVFFAQLSDNSGSFQNPIELGRVQSRTSGTINGRIPNNVSTGILYRVRVISTSPALVGADNRKNIKIYKGLNPVISGKASVCENDIEEYTSPVRPGVETIWNVVNGEILNIDTAKNSIITRWSNIGIGQVKIYQSIQNGKCSDSSKIIVKINPKPNKPIITRRGYTLYSSSKTGNQWYFFDQPIPNANADSLQVENPGLYFVQVTNEFGCKSEMSDPYDFYYSTVDLSESNISIFPNPAKEFLVIHPSTELTLLTIKDNYGRTIDRYEYLNSRELDKIDVSKLPSGVYYIQIVTKNSIIISKFIKVK
ncbi:MAG: T9SS type A sorting domain-containing protein [Candidatus Kapaibacteriota bacterium]